MLDCGGARRQGMIEVHLSRVTISAAGQNYSAARPLQRLVHHRSGLPPFSSTLRGHASPLSVLQTPACSLTLRRHDAPAQDIDLRPAG